MAHNLQDLINALFESSTSANRPSPEFASAIARSLNALGAKQPALFLNSVHTFLLQRSSKLPEKDKAFIFRSLASVLGDGRLLDECDEQTEQQVLLIVNLSTQEMSMAKNDDNGLASAAKDVLVTLGGKYGRFVNQVMDSLLNKFQPGHAPPHKFVIITMAEIAQKNANGFVPFLHDILARIDVLLAHLKNEQMRSAFCQSICAFVESVLESVSPNTRTYHDDCSSDNESNANVAGGEVKSCGDSSDVLENYSDQFEKIYDAILGWTSSSKELKCRADAAECVGTLCLMIQRERVLKDLKKLDSLFRYLHRKTSSTEEQLAITRGIVNFLQAACPDENIPIENYLNDLLELLFPHVCVLSEQSFVANDSAAPNMTQIKLRNEVFRCFYISSCRSADKEIYFLLHKMQSLNEPVKLGAINLLRHLLNSADAQMKENKALITMGLKPFLTEEFTTVRIKMSLCQLCVALADNEYLQADEAGQHVMQFLLNNLVPRNDPSKRVSVQQAASVANNETASMQNQLHAQCAQALSTIANTSKSAHSLLWPLLFEYVCMEQYGPVVADIFKCLRILCTRMRESGQELDFQFEDNPRLPGPVAVMSRLLVCMNGAPLSAYLNNRATESLRLFGELTNWFHRNFVGQPLVSKLSAQMLITLEQFCGTGGPATSACSTKFSTAVHREDYLNMEFKSVRAQRWQSLVLDMLCSLLETANDQEWTESLAAIQAKQLNLCSPSTLSQPSSSHELHPQSAHDKAFLMRCLGCTLARVNSPQFVTEHLLLLFRQTVHSVAPERVGCAMAIGHCAASLDHTDLVLTELENVAKWEHTKKGGTGSASAGGIFSFIKDSLPYGRTVDVEVLNLRATLVLSYGYVVFYCAPEGLLLRLQQTVLPFLRQYIANSKETIVREAHLETLNLIALSVHPNRIRDYKFEARYECFSYIKEYVNDEKSPETLTSWIRLLAAKATASLVQLDPPLTENEFVDISTVLIQNIFPICREKSGLKTLHPHCVFGFPHFTLHRNGWDYQRSKLVPLTGSHLPERNGADGQQQEAEKATNPRKEKKDKSGAKKENLRIEDAETSTVMEATICQCRNAIGNMVQRRPCVEPTLNKLLKMFHTYYGSDKDHERARAVDLTVLSLSIYSENASDCQLGVAKEFAPLSSLLGRLCPRLCDSLGSVRQLSIHAIWLTFKLSLLHRGHSPLDTDLVDSTLFSVAEFTDRHFGATNEGRLDSNKCKAAISDISKEVEKRLPQSQVQTYISALFKMLTDRQSNVSSAAAQLLSCIISDRGHSLHQEAEVLITSLLENLEMARSTKIQTYAELLNGFTMFSMHHQHLAIHVLLRQPLPYKQTILEVFEMMAHDHAQFAVAIDYVLELIHANTSANVPVHRAKNISPGMEATETSVGSGSGSQQEESQTPSVTQQPGATSESTQHSPMFVRPHFELIDLGGGSVIKVVSNEACALVCALNELIKKGEPEKALLERIPIVVATLLQVLTALVDTQYSNQQKHATVVEKEKEAVSTTTSPGTPKKGKKGTSPPKVPVVTSELTRISSVPANLVAQALKTLLSRIGAENVIERMNAERAWTNLSNPQQFTFAIASFCRALFDFRPCFVGHLMSIEGARVETATQNTSEAERIAAAAVLSALITKSPHENGKFDSELFVSTFHALEKSLRDASLTVRKLSINGLGHIGELRGPEAEELIQTFAPRSIDAALAGLDDHGDRQDQLASESISALDLLVHITQPALVVRVLPQLLLKVRPCFEKENASLRASAFSLFSGLGSSVGNSETFRESMHNNMVSIVLHLNDEEENVRVCCAKVLNTCAPLMNSEHASALIENGLTEGKAPSSYADFLRQFGMILAISFPDRLNTYALDCNNYFRSQSARIRQNAAMLIGFLLTALTPELRGTLSKDLLFNGLIQLIKDPDEEVRIQTVSAISLLYAFA